MMLTSMTPLLLMMLVLMMLTSMTPLLLMMLVLMKRETVIQTQGEWILAVQ